MWGAFKYHLVILCRGLYRSFCGTFTMTLLALAVHGFVIVSAGDGWVAVAYFIISVTVLAVFGVCVYFMGKGGKNA